MWAGLGEVCGLDGVLGLVVAVCLVDGGDAGGVFEPVVLRVLWLLGLLMGCGFMARMSWGVAESLGVCAPGLHLRVA